MQQLLKYMILFKMHFGIFFYLKHKPKVVASFIATNIIASLIATKGPSNQSYGFPSSHVRMWKLDYKESWVLKKWCFWTVVLDKTLEGPLDCKEIQPLNPKGNQSWIFIGKIYAEAEAPILWPTDEKNWLIGKDPDAGNDEGRRRRGWQRVRCLDGVTDLMDRSLNKLKQEFWVGDGQGTLVCCSPWVRKELDTNERLNWTDSH